MTRCHPAFSEMFYHSLHETPHKNYRQQVQVQPNFCRTIRERAREAQGKQNWQIHGRKGEGDRKQIRQMHQGKRRDLVGQSVATLWKSTVIGGRFPSHSLAIPCAAGCCPGTSKLPPTLPPAFSLAEEPQYLRETTEDSECITSISTAKGRQCYEKNVWR